MIKTHYRDYATDAWRLYARLGSAEAYKRRIYAEAQQRHAEGGSGGVGSPTEAAVLRDAGVDDYHSDAQVEHYVMPGEGRHSGDITRSWTVVRGGTKSRPEKIFNRNGLMPKGAGNE